MERSAEMRPEVRIENCEEIILCISKEGSEETRQSECGNECENESGEALK